MREFDPYIIPIQPYNIFPIGPQLINRLLAGGTELEFAGGAGGERQVEMEEECSTPKYYMVVRFRV